MRKSELEKTLVLGYRPPPPYSASWELSFWQRLFGMAETDERTSTCSDLWINED